MTHFPSQHYVGLVTLNYALTLKMVCIIARGVDNLPTNFGVARMFRSRLIGQQLSSASYDLATLTFNLESHGACC